MFTHPVVEIDRVVDGIQQIDDAIAQLASCTMQDEGNELTVSLNNIVLPGEGCAKQGLSETEFGELMVSAGAAKVTDPDEIDELITQTSTMDSRELHIIINVSTDNCQWHDFVNAGDLGMLRMLQAKMADAAAPNLTQPSL